MGGYALGSPVTHCVHFGGTPLSSAAFSNASEFHRFYVLQADASLSAGAKRSNGTPPKTLRRLSRPGEEDDDDEGYGDSGTDESSRPPNLVLEGLFLVLALQSMCSWSHLLFFAFFACPCAEKE